MYLKVEEIFGLRSGVLRKEVNQAEDLKFPRTFSNQISVAFSE